MRFAFFLLKRKRPFGLDVYLDGWGLPCFHGLLLGCAALEELDEEQEEVPSAPRQQRDALMFGCLL